MNKDVSWWQGPDDADSFPWKHCVRMTKHSHIALMAQEHVLIGNYNSGYGQCRFIVKV